jgi:hypothetical protein
MPSAPSIAFDIRSSRALASVATLVLVGGATSVLLAEFPLWLQGLLCVAGLGAGVWELHRYAHLRYVRASGQGSDWTLVDAQGRGHVATLRGHRRLGPFVQVEFDVVATRFTHLLAPDNSDADARRRLLLILAHGSAQESAQSSI